MSLSGKVAIVTGAGRGIGRGIALRLAEAGADVVATDVLDDDVCQTANQVRALGRSALALQIDVSQREQVEAMVHSTVDQLGRLDILVNNAGLMSKKPLLEVTEAEWDRLIDVNLKGPFLCSQAVVRHFVGARIRGKIVNIASVESEIAFPDSVPYATSKGGVAMMTRALAYDLARYGINVNAVGPGTTDNGHNFTDPERLARYKQLVPLGRVATVGDIANAVLFLASDQADYVTGHVLYVDGGLLTY
jgi:NAD(P)-dependent dehydrogenase (short-subunit alcohol dehydrogenase family)